MSMESQLKNRLGDLLNRPRAEVTATPHAPPDRRKDPNLFYLAIDRIRIDEQQARKENKSETDPEVIELSESIKELGVLEPINVRYLEEENYYKIVAGERRFTAAKMAGLAEIPVKLLNVPESRVKKLQLTENIHRANFTPMELSEALHDMSKDGATLDELAKLLHKSKAFVQKALGVARHLTPEVKEMATDMTMDHLYEISQVPENKQEDVVQFVKENNVSTKDLRELVSDMKPETRGGRPSGTKTFKRTISCSNGINVTFSSKQSTQTTLELLGALAEAKKLLSKEEQKGTRNVA